MKISEITASGAQLNLSTDELITLSNALNEICYGLDISDGEIELRIGESHTNISNLLTKLLKVVDEIETQPLGSIESASNTDADSIANDVTVHV